MNNVTIVGATSPLGVAIAPWFADKDWKVFAGYRDHTSIPGQWLGNDRITPAEADIASGRIDNVIFDSDVVLWLSHLDAGRFNDAEVELNCSALLRFLDRVNAARTRRFIFVSSGGSVYGSALSLPIEEDHPREPLSSYGRAKRAMEDEVISYGRRAGVPTAILRPGNIYGFERPDRKCKGVTAAFLNAVDHDLAFTLVHGGETVRDFVHVDDVCSAVLLTAEQSNPEMVCNIGTGIGTSTIDWIEMLRAEIGAAMPEIVAKENYTSDVLENVLSSRRISETTGWRPSVSVREGVRRAAAHWRAFSETAVAR